MTTKKVRKDRSDATVGAVEKKHGMPSGTIRNADGRDTRSDKKLGTIRKKASKKVGARETKDGNFVQIANEHMERAWDKIYDNREKARKVG
jgi:hypothetical protein